ncbi:hypothetical protein JSE7799_03521 [Jannaschia seosinensis]|uniref:Uncharacterized protein n=2 Tax=Jannaschia seosinensis TaxID=313367 RepID=A0A0M7BG03_9RHOB|nr:hypothetical protein JSE7799_03521 [Jannaschia seosinensis]
MPGNLPDQPADVGRALGPVGAAGRAQQCPHEPAFAVKHDDRLEAELVVERIEQAQLLVAMHRVKGIIDIEHDPAWGARKRVAVEPDHLVAHADKGAGVGQVLHARDRRLRTRGRPCFRATLQRDPEAGIVPQGRRVVAVFVSRPDHHDPEPDDVAQAMLNFRRVTRIVQAICEPLRQTRPALDLAQQGQAGVGAHVGAVKPEQDRLAIEG